MTVQVGFFQQFFFEYYPYIAATIFVVGSLLRFNYAQYGWKSGSSQFVSKRGMRVASNFFHVGILLLFLGHLVGLLTPESLYTLVISVHHKQMMAMIAGGVFGTFAFIGLTFLVFRRLFVTRVRTTGSWMDIFIILLLYVQLMLGLATIPLSAIHSSGTEMEALAYWAQHIVTFRAGAAAFIVNVPMVFKLHIILGLTIFVIFPFTRLVHIFSAPVLYVTRVGYQIVRRRGSGGY